MHLKVPSLVINWFSFLAVQWSSLPNTSIGLMRNSLMGLLNAKIAVINHTVTVASITLWCTAWQEPFNHYVFLFKKYQVSHSRQVIAHWPLWTPVIHPFLNTVIIAENQDKYLYIHPFSEALILPMVSFPEDSGHKVGNTPNMDMVVTHHRAQSYTHSHTHYRQFRNQPTIHVFGLQVEKGIAEGKPQSMAWNPQPQMYKPNKPLILCVPLDNYKIDNTTKWNNIIKCLGKVQDTFNTPWLRFYTSPVL